MRSPPSKHQENTVDPQAVQKKDAVGAPNRLLVQLKGKNFNAQQAALKPGAQGLAVQPQALCPVQTKDTTVGSSAIDGVGLHATKPLEAGKTLLSNAMSETREGGHVAADTGKVNHSSQPNAAFTSKGDHRSLDVTAPIQAGQEITADYTDNPDWIEGTKPGYG